MLFTPRPKGLGSENFLKLSDGEEVTGLFKGEIHIFKQHWTNERSIECTGATCSFCLIETEKVASGEDKKRFPSFRFRINFIISKDGQWLAKIFESGGETYDELTSLDKKVDLTKTFIDITRRGLKKNTKYSFFVRTSEPLTKEIMAKINAVQLLPLTSSQEQV